MNNRKRNNIWVTKDGEHEIGKGLFHLVFWLCIQAIILAILEAFRLLPGDLIGLDPIIEHGRFPWADSFNIICAIAGFIYTTVGCITIVNYEVNSFEWWKRVIGWYMLYIILIFLPIYDLEGWRVIDAWLAPVIWLGEIELVYYIQKGVAQRKKPSFA